MPSSATRNKRSFSASSDASRWDAVQRRDTNADNLFCYSVATTGVYCRPSCAARLPRRENVQFHASCAEAERAGFRPCKRCRPNEPALHERQSLIVAKACRAIEAADDIPDLDTLAEAAGMSRFHFHRVFKAHTGVTPKAYADAHRGKRVQDVLSNSTSVTAAIYDAGFNSNSRFYETSNDRLGMTPTQFRAGGRDAEIHFAYAPCSLGTILVAASHKGVCMIQLGDDADALMRDLRNQFPNAHLISNDKAFEQLIAKVVGLVETPGRGVNLPLDIRGTAFQQLVWQQLREIPAGSTASYSEIARRIGQPKAVRAVARACAANTIAVAIPCHRVVRTDGSLSGYRWGVERKRALLAREERS
jgi:AraC family transcriptional regulator of adaptative response/methylated-DNA-[protein]-cysteine methyltransferase